MEYLATGNWFWKFIIIFLSIIKFSLKKKFIHNMHLDPFRIEIIENSDMFRKVWVIVEILSKNHEVTTILSEFITFLKKMYVHGKNLPIFLRLLNLVLSPVSQDCGGGNNFHNIFNGIPAFVCLLWPFPQRLHDLWGDRGHTQHLDVLVVHFFNQAREVWSLISNKDMWLQLFDEDLRMLDVTLNRATLIFALSVILAAAITFVILAAAVIYIIIIIFVIVDKPVNFFTWPRFNFLVTSDNVDWRDWDKKVKYEAEK